MGFYKLEKLYPDSKGTINKTPGTWDGDGCVITFGKPLWIYEVSPEYYLINPSFFKLVWSIIKRRCRRTTIRIRK